MHVDKRYLTNSPDPDDGNPEDEDKRTIFCPSLHEKITEELLCELFLQAGPVESVRIPTDRDGRSRNFGFITYAHSCSVPYALELFHGVKLYKRPLIMRSNANQQQQQRPNKEYPYRMPPPPQSLAGSSFQFERDDRNSREDKNLGNSSKRYDNFALRSGESSSSHIRFDNDMHPKDNDKPTTSRNPFKVDLDTLSRLSSNILPVKGRQNNKKDNEHSSQFQRRGEHHPYKGQYDYNRHRNKGNGNNRNGQHSKDKQKRR